MKNKISVGCRKSLFAGYIYAVLRHKSVKKRTLPFFCCILVNNREIIKCTFSGKPCRTKSVKNSTFSLECFLDDYKNRNKKFNVWTKVAETLQSEVAQVTVRFSVLQRTRNSSMRKHYERHRPLWPPLGYAYV